MPTRDVGPEDALQTVAAAVERAAIEDGCSEER